MLQTSTEWPFSSAVGYENHDRPVGQSCREQSAPVHPDEHAHDHVASTSHTPWPEHHASPGQLDVWVLGNPQSPRWPEFPRPSDETKMSPFAAWHSHAPSVAHRPWSAHSTFSLVPALDCVVPPPR